MELTDKQSLFFSKLSTVLSELSILAEEINNKHYTKQKSNLTFEQKPKTLPVKKSETIKLPKSISNQYHKAATRILTVLNLSPEGLHYIGIYELLKHEKLFDPSIKCPIKVLNRLLVKMTKAGLIKHPKRNGTFYPLEANKPIQQKLMFDNVSYRSQSGGLEKIEVDPNPDRIRVGKQVIDNLIKSGLLYSKSHLINKWRDECRHDKIGKEGPLGYTKFKDGEHVFESLLEDYCKSDSGLKKIVSLKGNVYYGAKSIIPPPNLR